MLQAGWEAVLPERGPFDVLFFDGDGRGAELSRIVDLVAPGEILVKDDLTPGRAIEGDPVREAFLRDPRFVSVELLTTSETAAIVAVRRS